MPRSIPDFRLPALRPLFAAALLVAAPAPAAFACGPFFPATVINQGDAGLLTPLGRDFASSLARLHLPAPTFPHVTLGSPEAERADLVTAGAGEAVLAVHATLRGDLERLAAGASAEPSAPPSTEPPPAFPGAPEEFALYLRGAHEWLGGHPDAACATFASLLALPPEQRRFKSTWAAFSLGQLAAAAGDSTEASRRFAETRALARAGFADTAGLATASLGLEAKLHYDRKAWAPACELYLQQHANGAPSALNSLLFTLTAALTEDEPAGLTAFARSPVLRPLMTARILALSLPADNRYVPNANQPAALRWLESLETAQASDAAEAETFALAAYRLGAFTEARRWLALAPAASAPARWLRAKLALMDNRADDALVLLSGLVREPDTAFSGLLADNRDDYLGTPDRSATRSLQGELGALRLARRDYTEAARLLLDGGYWADAAYIAERVLTTTELRAWVEQLPASTPDLPAIRLLLARRLVREQRPAEARPYFTPELRARLDAHLAHLEAGADPRRDRVARARDLFAAARILRHDGLELRGAELAPDYAIWGGNYEAGPDLGQRLRAGGAASPSADEISRATIPAALPDLRFHYRPLAAELAWQAAELYPDGHNELAALLTEAGGWLKARDPRAADRFYKALVERCPETALGRAAQARRWFP